MIKPDLTDSKTLEEFYERIVDAQQEAHGVEYTRNHDAIFKYGSMGCRTAKELGVCQGASLAAMLLSGNFESVTGIDITSEHFKPYVKLFTDYAVDYRIRLTFMQEDSTDPITVSDVDLLHIDSLHTPVQLMKELKLHAPHVNRYIVFHDTANYQNTRGLLKTIVEYITEIDQNWTIVNHVIHRVGTLTIERTSRIGYK